MKFKRIIIYILAGFIVASGFAVKADSGSARADALPTAELSRLNEAIKSADLYMEEKTRHLDSISSVLKKLPAGDLKKRWRLSQSLSEGYIGVRADSALYYSDLGIEIAKEAGLQTELYKSRIARINALSTAGIFIAALPEFEALDSVAKTREMKILYWRSGRRLFGYMSVYLEANQRFYDDYNARYMQYDDSLMQNLPEGDNMRSFYQAERFVSNGKYEDAREILMKLVEKLPEESNLYGMAAYQLGVVSQFQGNNHDYAAWLAKASISDIKGCVKDGIALPALAEWLYHRGELDIAFEYINFALEESTSGDVRMRTVAIAQLLPIIDDAYREKINASRDELMVYFILVTFLLIISIGLAILMFRMIRRGRQSERKLARTAEMQENYIGNFIGLSSTYATRLERLQKLVMRKLSSGQGDDLLKMIKSGRFGDDSYNDDFYKIFDSAFLDIYPDFIAGVNALLRPEERIVLDNPRELTPELRIYALVRLGVNESTRISQILNYSVSTIYSYRNRMRKRALDRDKFEEEVMHIGKSLGGTRN